jgi:hypothetical protein
MIRTINNRKDNSFNLGSSNLTNQFRKHINKAKKWIMWYYWKWDIWIEIIQWLIKFIIPTNFHEGRYWMGNNVEDKIQAFRLKWFWKIWEYSKDIRTINSGFMKMDRANIFWKKILKSCTMEIYHYLEGY